MENCFSYSVAGHSFSISLPDGYSAEDCLPSYSPFASEAQDEVEMRLEVVPAAEPASRFCGSLEKVFGDEPPYLWLFRREEGYRWYFGFSVKRDAPAIYLDVDGSFSRAAVYVPEGWGNENMKFCINNSMMLLYAFRTISSGTLLVHASVVAAGSGAYMFLGKSGTGKSTHSRLWLKNVQGSELLNDDNPVIRVIDGEAMVFGTPWSGKTHCYRNMSLPLKAVVKLSQAPFNKIRQLSAIESFAAIMASCSSMRWETEASELLHQAVEKVVQLVNVWHLECLPDDEAAELCFSTCSVQEKEVVR